MQSQTKSLYQASLVVVSESGREGVPAVLEPNGRA